MIRPKIANDLPVRKTDVMDCFWALLIKERAREQEDIGKRERQYRIIRNRCEFTMSDE